MSIHIELPTDLTLESLAPEKKPRDIRQAMGRLRMRIDDAKGEAEDARTGRPRPRRFAPAGQSTQMIVGADGTDDDQILGRPQPRFRLRR